MTTVSGTYWAELAIEYEGEAVPYRAATQADPAEGGDVEDIAVTGLNAEIVTRVSATTKRSIVNLLDGCDLKSPDIQRLLMNLTSAFESDLRDAARFEASEGAE